MEAHQVIFHIMHFTLVKTTLTSKVRALLVEYIFFYKNFSAVQFGDE